MATEAAYLQRGGTQGSFLFISAGSTTSQFVASDGTKTLKEQGANGTGYASGTVTMGEPGENYTTLFDKKINAIRKGEPKTVFLFNHLAFAATTPTAHKPTKPTN